MVHSRTEDRLTVQTYPKAHRVGPSEVGQGMMSEVARSFIMAKVEIGEDNDTGRGML